MTFRPVLHLEAMSGKTFFVISLIAHKLFIALGIICGVWVVHGNSGHWEDVLTVWDKSEYLHLARHGYQAGHPSCAFYPFFPTLIRVVAPLLGGRDLMAGLILVNITGIIAFFLFYRLVQIRYGLQCARFALVFLLVFPGCLFTSFIFTESFFFLEMMLVFYGMTRGRPAIAALGGFLMPLTRPIGLFVLVVLAIFAVNRILENHPASEPSRNPRTNSFLVKGNLQWLAAGIFPLAGMAVYFGLMWQWTGDPLEGFKAQRFYPYQPSIENIFNVTKWGAAFLNWNSLHGSTDSILDRSFFVIFLASLYWIWKLDKMYFIWALCAGLIPALSNCFFSYSRYIIMVFPLFIVLGLHLCRGKRWIAWYYAILLGILQFYFTVRYVNGLWVG